MRVLIDYHHSDLMESMHRLFEDRLGFEVHVPHGMEWFEQSIWRQGHEHFGDAIARQFLLGPEVDDLQPHRKLRQTTLAEAREMGDWALVIASVPDNEIGYHAFAQEQGARYGVEVGNVNQWVNHSLEPLILDSTGQYPGGIPFTPEFDLSVFHRSPLYPPGIRVVSSFVNLFNGLPCYPEFLQTMEWLPNAMSYVYGHGAHEQPSDGFIKAPEDIASAMRLSDFGWHDKVTGDGFGYVIHKWAAVGRPIIGHAHHYAGQVAADLWEDGVTCIDLDRHTPQETAQLMDEIVKDRPRHAAMGEAIHDRFMARVDFAADAERVADAMALVPA